MVTFVTVRCGLRLSVGSSSLPGSTGGSSGSGFSGSGSGFGRISPVAVAVFTTVFPRSLSCTSYWKSTSLLSPGARVSGSLELPSFTTAPASSSTATTFSMVTFPSLVTVTVYSITSPSTYAVPLSGVLVVTFVTVRCGLRDSVGVSSVSSSFVGSLSSGSSDTSPVAVAVFTIIFPRSFS